MGYTKMSEREELNERVFMECFRLTLHHEYMENGERVIVDKPLTVQCMFPLGELFRVPCYNKQEVVGMLYKRLVEYIMEEEE